MPTPNVTLIDVTLRENSCYISCPRRKFDVIIFALNPTINTKGDVTELHRGGKRVGEGRGGGGEANWLLYKL